MSLHLHRLVIFQQSSTSVMQTPTRVHSLLGSSAIHLSLVSPTSMDQQEESPMDAYWSISWVRLNSSSLAIFLPKRIANDFIFFSNWLGLAIPASIHGFLGCQLLSWCKLCQHFIHHCITYIKHHSGGQTTPRTQSCQSRHSGGSICTIRKQITNTRFASTFICTFFNIVILMYIVPVWERPLLAFLDKKPASVFIDPSV